MLDLQPDRCRAAGAGAGRGRHRRLPRAAAASQLEPRARERGIGSLRGPARGARGRHVRSRPPASDPAQPDRQRAQVHQPGPCEPARRPCSARPSKVGVRLHRGRYRAQVFRPRRSGGCSRPSPSEAGHASSVRRQRAGSDDRPAAATRYGRRDRGREPRRRGHAASASISPLFPASASRPAVTSIAGPACWSWIRSRAVPTDGEHRGWLGSRRPYCRATGRQALALLAEAADRGAPFDIVLIDRAVADPGPEELAAVIAADPPPAPCPARAPRRPPGSAATRRAAGPRGSPPICASRWRRRHCSTACARCARDPRAGRPANHGPQHRGAQAAPPALLLADDNPVNAKLAPDPAGACRAIGSIGGRRPARGRAVDRQPYDLVLLDVQMPVMGGLEAAARESVRCLTQHAPGCLSSQ